MGHADNGTDEDFFVTRYNADGSLDTGFGTGGTFTLDLANSDYAKKVIVQDDGKILIAGTINNQINTDVAVIRLEANGTLDLGFGGGGAGGIQTTDVNGMSDRAGGLAIQNDGKYVVAGYTFSNEWNVLRFNPDGSLDTTFGGGDGKVQTNVGTSSYNTTSVVVADDGSIFVAGGANTGGTGDDHVLVKYDSLGNVDTSFGGGIVTIDNGGVEEINDIAIQSDGKVVAVGQDANGSLRSVIMRFNTDGTLDGSFGTGGEVIFNDYGSGEFNAVELTADGKILVAGDANNDFIIARFDENGNLDERFSLVNTLDGNPTYVEDGVPVVLDANVEIFDADIDRGEDTFENTTLTLVRNGGANGEDVFSATGLLGALTEGGNLVYNSVTVGTVTTNSGGTLLLTFNAAADNSAINNVMQAIAYSNNSDGPPASVQIEWSFDDHNDSSNQGGVGSLTATGSTTVNIGAINDAPVVTAPGSSYNYTEQGSLNIHGSGFSVADPDDNGGAMTATFTVGEGRVLIDAGDSGVVVQSGDRFTSGNNTDTVTFTGTKAQLNALLSGVSTGTVVYRHDQTVASDTPSAATVISLTVNDQGNSGVDPGDTADGSSEEHTASQTINITSANDAPVLRGPELVTNGDFTTDLSGWTPTNSAVYSASTARFGIGNAPGPHTLSQTINTVAGETYVLEFDHMDDSVVWNQQVQVTVDGSSNLLTSEQIVSDTEDASFVRYRYLFTADSSTATLTFTDTSDDVGSYSAESGGVDGYLDNISVRQAGGQLGTVSYTEDGTSIALDGDVTLIDAEIDTALDDYDGATLSLARNGGANSDDQLGIDLTSGLGLSSETSGGPADYFITFGGDKIAQWHNFGAGDGSFLIEFINDGGHVVTNADVNALLQGILYTNNSDTPPASVQIDWVFNDGNAASVQGSGGALDASASTIVNITAANDDRADRDALDRHRWSVVSLFQWRSYRRGYRSCTHFHWHAGQSQHLLRYCIEHSVPARHCQHQWQ